MPPRKRRSYTAEYKVEAAHRVIDSGRTISEVARELGIDAGMLRALFTWLDHLNIGQRPRSSKIVFLPQNTTYGRGRCDTSLLQGLTPTRSTSLSAGSGRLTSAVRNNYGLRLWDFIVRF